MLTLDYQLDPSGAARARTVDLALEDAGSLHYEWFPGDVIFHGEGVDFSARWGWVQVLDFALCLAKIAETLHAVGQATYEYTEATAALIFRLEGEDVVVSATYAPGVLRIPHAVFLDLAVRFAQRVTADLCRDHPRLAMNPEMTRPSTP